MSELEHGLTGYSFTPEHASCFFCWSLLLIALPPAKVTTFYTNLYDMLCGAFSTKKAPASAAILTEACYRATGACLHPRLEWIGLPQLCHQGLSSHPL